MLRGVNSSNRRDAHAPLLLKTVMHGFIEKLNELSEMTDEFLVVKKIIVTVTKNSECYVVSTKNV